MSAERSTNANSILLRTASYFGLVGLRTCRIAGLRSCGLGQPSNSTAAQNLHRVTAAQLPRDLAHYQIWKTLCKFTKVCPSRRSRRTVEPAFWPRGDATGGHPYALGVPSERHCVSTSRPPQPVRLPKETYLNPFSLHLLITLHLEAPHRPHFRQRPCS